MRVQLTPDPEGGWRASVWTDAGADHHAVGREPWRALMRLAVYWEEVEEGAKTAKVQDMMRMMQLAHHTPGLLDLAPLRHEAPDAK